MLVYLLTPYYLGQARKTETSLQRIRQGAQRRGGASSDVSDHNVSDTDKICMQLFLDIQVRNDPHCLYCMCAVCRYSNVFFCKIT